MTATWRNREELVHQLVTLAKQGTSQRELSKTLGISRNTVRALLAAHRARGDRAPDELPPRPRRAPRASKVDAFDARIAELLDRYPDITAQRVFEALRAEGFDGGYTAVKKRVRLLRPPPRPEPSRVTPLYEPGAMSECDWSPYDVTFTSGERDTVQAFSYVLVTSRRKSFGIYRQSDLHALMDGHVRAFQRFDGCAHACKYDSQKPVVLRWEGQQPIYNPRFLAFSTHYEFRPVAVRRGHPNDKPRVERSFWELERSFLNGRSFADIDDMRAQLAHWLNTVADLRLRHGKSPLDRFADERDLLLPLPRHPYDTARVIYRVCSIDGFVAWDGNQYAVPYDRVTDILPVRITQRELLVYAPDLCCVARHELAPRGAGLRLDPAGLHPPPQRKSLVDLDQLRVAFGQMGERSADFFRLMSAGPPRIWGHQARQILLLRDRFDTADLDAALGHAAMFGATDHHAVERIVTARSRPRKLDEYVAEQTIQRIAQTLGGARTSPRDLTEYDRLPAIGSPRAPHPETTTCPDENPCPAPPHGPPATIPSSSGSDATSTCSG